MKIEKVEKLVNLHDKTEHVIHTKNLKQALNNKLLLKKFHRMIKFNQELQVKTYIDMNTKLRKKAKNEDFFKLMNNAVFGNTMENVREHRDIQLVTTEKQKKQETIKYQNQIIKLQSFSQKIYSQQKWEKLKYL